MTRHRAQRINRQRPALVWTCLLRITVSRQLLVEEPYNIIIRNTIYRCVVCIIVVISCVLLYNIMKNSFLSNRVYRSNRIIIVIILLYYNIIPGIRYITFYNDTLYYYYKSSLTVRLRIIRLVYWNFLFFYNPLRYTRLYYNIGSFFLKSIFYQYII